MFLSFFFWINFLKKKVFFDYSFSTPPFHYSSQVQMGNFLPFRSYSLIGPFLLTIFIAGFCLKRSEKIWLENKSIREGILKTSNVGDPKRRGDP